MEHSFMRGTQNKWRKRAQFLTTASSPEMIEMKKSVLQLKAKPEKKLDPPEVAQDERAATVSRAGFLLLGTDAGKRKLYYQLIGNYLVQFNNKEAPIGTPFLPTYVQGIEDILRAVAASDNPEALKPQFIAQIESKGTRFHVYTPTRTLHLYAESLEEQRGWIDAINGALTNIFSADELAIKANSENRLRPLMLKQEYTEFMRFNSILSNMVGAGMIDKGHVWSHKKGFLLFQRLEYEDEQFYANLLPDAAPKEPQWSKMFCLLRSDMTLTYGKSEKEAKCQPEGVISLSHLHVELDHDRIEETGKMVFSLVTPMRTFVLCAPHQVSLEEWLRSIVKRRARRTRQPQAPDPPIDIDIYTILDTDSGVDAYAHFVARLQGKPRVTNVFACWKLAKEFKDINEFEDDSQEHNAQCKQLAALIIDAFLRADSPLPPEISTDIREEIVDAAERGEIPTINGLRAACLKYLHDTTYKDFQKSEYYKRLMSQLAGVEAEPCEPIPKNATRILIHVPSSPAEFKRRIKKGSRIRTKLMMVGVNSNGAKVYEAWTSINFVEGKTTELIIGRDVKTDLTIDDDKKVSREHARIDCRPDGACVFLDLGSSHGSKVNGKIVSGRVNLAVGDLIKVGKTKLLFTIIPSGQDEPLT
ncbi:hypothetical protein CTAYLR_005217 [Chrysophaeum taylorii]|uniref:Uncharacterized protein n=1 Tax=Chrysophaeum taylorii TaxID=2483200 RepID=A0AAD7XKJ7_9STRA|nr:hypothetical protein CTAYLR_005217 [Chrysophaeum taylorii]